MLLVSLVIAATVALAVPMALLGLTDLQRVSDLVLPLTALALFPAATLATWFTRRFIDRRSFGSLGLELGPHTWRDLLVGVAIPAPLFGLAYAAYSAFGWLDFGGWTWSLSQAPVAVLSLFVMVVVFMAVGFYEELVFRGYYLHNLADGINLPAAVLLSSAVFGLAHIGNPGTSWASIAGVLLAGLFLAFAWLRTGSLWLPIGIHIGWNFFQGPVFGFPVSGIRAYRLIQQSVHGPQLASGGAFGPEASLVLLPLLAIGAVLVWWYTRGRAGAPFAQPD